MRPAFVSLSILLAVAVVPSAARADVAPPNSSQCASKSAGVACTTDDGKAGACVASTCSKLDYSDGTPPGTVTYTCLLCTAGAAPSSSTSSTPKEGGSGCTSSGAARAVGPWALALSVPALFLLARRRRAGRR